MATLRSLLKQPRFLIVAALIAWPAVLLPLVSLSTAVVFGIGAALGTASGARALRNGDPSRRRLTP